MNVPYINKNELSHVSKDYNTILVVVNEEDQMFKMTCAQVLKLKDYYKDRFKYFVVKKEDISCFLHRTFTVFPQIIIMNKANPVAFIRGFRSTKEINRTIELTI